VWPAWDASKENFSRTFLNFSTITSPPSPGTGSPDYTGYPVNLWGTVRDNIGISYAGLDSMVILADDFKCHGYKKIIGTLNANGKKFGITGDYQSDTNY
jgi:hypothetical protein